MKCAHPRAPSPAPRSHTEEEERTEGVLNPTRRATCRARFLDRSSAAPSPRCLLTIILRSLGAVNSGRVSLFPRDEGLLSPDFGSESNSQHFSNTQLREELTAKGTPRSNVRTPPREGGDIPHTRESTQGTFLPAAALGDVAESRRKYLGLALPTFPRAFSAVREWQSWWGTAFLEPLVLGGQAHEPSRPSREPPRRPPSPGLPVPPC